MESETGPGLPAIPTPEGGLFVSAFRLQTRNTGCGAGPGRRQHGDQFVGKGLAPSLGGGCRVGRFPVD